MLTLPLICTIRPLRPLNSSSNGCIHTLHPLTPSINTPANTPPYMYYKASLPFEFFEQRMYGPQEDEIGEDGMNPLRFAKTVRLRYNGYHSLHSHPLNPPCQDTPSPSSLPLYTPFNTPSPFPLPLSFPLIGMTQIQWLSQPSFTPYQPTLSRHTFSLFPPSLHSL